jgi:hypothetical protein
MLDSMTNALLERKESGFRDALYEKYHGSQKRIAAAVPDTDLSEGKHTLQSARHHTRASTAAAATTRAFICPSRAIVTFSATMCKKV